MIESHENLSLGVQSWGLIAAVFRPFCEAVRPIRFFVSNLRFKNEVLGATRRNTELNFFVCSALPATPKSGFFLPAG